MFGLLDNVSMLTAIKEWGYIPLHFLNLDDIEEASRILFKLEQNLLEQDLIVGKLDEVRFNGFFSLTPKGQNYLTVIALECVPLASYEVDKYYWIDQRQQDAFFSRELGGES